ncbi:hypothetical protein NFI96_006287 [Prochilodus magdalenae]|nr:hypothetical protein NFI96_006287 [Prochilodus magdalenae]
MASAQCLYLHISGRIAKECFTLEREHERQEKKQPPKGAGSAQAVSLETCVSPDEWYRPLSLMGRCLCFMQRKEACPLPCCVILGQHSRSYVRGSYPGAPVKGVDFILGDDLARGQVVPVVVVSGQPCAPVSTDKLKSFSGVFPACAVTRAQAEHTMGVVDLSDSVVAGEEPFVPSPPAGSSNRVLGVSPLSSSHVTRKEFISGPQRDETLAKCLLSGGDGDVGKRQVAFFFDGGVLMRKWASHANVSDAGVVDYWGSCGTCQKTGKPNQVIPPAPLPPIPVTATRFPEAIPLRNITAQNAVKALGKVFTTFDLPRVTQTDQGSNFTSKLFAQRMQLLRVRQERSSPHHPESRGALERFPQSLKSMLRKYSLENGRDWDEGEPVALFAAQEAKQES